MRASPAIRSCEATRIGLRVRGRVQGVGFRPFVYRLARELSLRGWVRNDGAGVEIDIEGAPERLAHFRSRLRAELPPLAHIEQLDEELCRPRSQTRAFAIVASRDCAIRTQIAPDAAVCDECLAEVLDRTNRRYRYALTSCTHCGPARHAPRSFRSIAPKTESSRGTSGWTWTNPPSPSREQRVPV